MCSKCNEYRRTLNVTPGEVTPMEALAMISALGARFLALRQAFPDGWGHVPNEVWEEMAEHCLDARAVFLRVIEERLADEAKGSAAPVAIGSPKAGKES